MNREVIKEGETGFIIPVKDPKALANCMRNVVTNKVDLTTMGQSAIEYVKQFDTRSVLSEELMRKIGLK